MKPTADDRIRIETIFNAPADIVWKAWTDPRVILQWFGSDPKGEGLKANMDVRVNGSFEISFKDSDGTEHTCGGVYTDVREFNQLVFTWHWKNEPGVESLVIILLSKQGNNTRMNFEHANVGNASRHNYLIGWKTTFEKLDRLLATN